MENMEPHILKTIRTKTWGFFFRTDVLKKLAISSTILGGGAQVLFIYSVSPVYLRFFSVTQMISDSLVIAINIFSLLILPFLIISTLLSLRVMLHTDGLIFTIILIISGLIGIHIKMFQLGDGNVIFSFLICSSIGIFLLFFIYFLLNFPYENHLIKFAKEHGEKGFLNVCKFISLILLVSFFIVFYMLFMFINNNSNMLKHYMFNMLVMSDNMINKNNICNNLSKELCNVKYFNDKYIFLERENKKIEILKFDAFFNKESKQD